MGFVCVCCAVGVCVHNNNVLNFKFLVFTASLWCHQESVGAMYGNLWCWVQKWYWFDTFHHHQMIFGINFQKFGSETFFPNLGCWIQKWYSFSVRTKISTKYIVYKINGIWTRSLKFWLWNYLRVVCCGEFENDVYFTPFHQFSLVCFDHITQ